MFISTEIHGSMSLECLVWVWRQSDQNMFEKSLKMPQKYTKSVFKGWRGGRTTSVLICLLLRRSRRVDRHQNEVSTTSRSRDPFSMGDIWKLAPGRVLPGENFGATLLKCLVWSIATPSKSLVMVGPEIWSQQSEIADFVKISTNMTSLRHDVKTSRRFYGW